jgi:hypothetical protein
LPFKDVVYINVKRGAKAKLLKRKSKGESKKKRRKEREKFYTSRANDAAFEICGPIRKRFLGLVYSTTSLPDEIWTTKKWLTG